MPGINVIAASDAQRYVKKSNEFISANVDDMTLKETQLMELAVSLIRENSRLDERIRVTIERKTLDMLFGLNGMSNIKLRQLAEQLQSRAITLRPRAMGDDLDLFDGQAVAKERDTDWIRMVIVPTCEYRDGRFTLTFNQDLNAHLVELRERVTSYRLTNIVGMSSPYHVRLYGILAMQRNTARVVIDIARLRDMLGTQDKYPAFFEFRRRVLDPAVVSVNAHTDIDVEYEAVRSNKEVSQIIFHTRPKSMSDAESAHDPIMDMLLSAGVPEASVMKIMSVHSGPPDTIELHILAAQQYMQRLSQRQGSSVNPVGVFYKAVKEKWLPHAPQEKPVQPGVTNKEKPSENKSGEAFYEKSCAEIESTPDAMRNFERYLTRQRDSVSLLILQQQGLRSAGLRRVVAEYWQHKN